jgi:AraC-like DNA-binding protein
LGFFRDIVHRPQWVAGGRDTPRHRHLEAYATVVLDGAYEQFAYAGHLRVQPGEVLVQPTLDCHADSMLSTRVRLLRLPWPRDEGLGGVFRSSSLDLVLRTAGRDVAEASALLVESLRRATAAEPLHDGPADALASALRADPRLAIGCWARANGLVRETAARAFLRRYGTTPVRFRGEYRARQAWLRATGTTETLAAIAADLGFSDQAHMSRCVRRISGAPPQVWRKLAA